MGGGTDLALEQIEEAGEELGDGTFFVDRVMREAGKCVVEDGLGAEDDEGHVAGDGDLLLIFADAIARTWKQIQEFQPEGTEAAPSESASQAPSLPAGFGDFEDFGFDDDVQLIRDERGVRIADTEESD